MYPNQEKKYQKLLSIKEKRQIEKEETISAQKRSFLLKKKEKVAKCKKKSNFCFKKRDTLNFQRY